MKVGDRVRVRNAEDLIYPNPVVEGFLVQQVGMLWEVCLDLPAYRASRVSPWRTWVVQEPEWNLDPLGDSRDAEGVA